MGKKPSLSNVTTLDDLFALTRGESKNYDELHDLYCSIKPNEVRNLIKNARSNFFDRAGAPVSEEIYYQLPENGRRKTPSNLGAVFLDYMSDIHGYKKDENLQDSAFRNWLSKKENANDGVLKEDYAGFVIRVISQWATQNDSTKGVTRIGEELEVLRNGMGRRNLEGKLSEGAQLSTTMLTLLAPFTQGMFYGSSAPLDSNYSWWWTSNFFGDTTKLGTGILNLANAILMFEHKDALMTATKKEKIAYYGIMNALGGLSTSLAWLAPFSNFLFKASGVMDGDTFYHNTYLPALAVQFGAYLCNRAYLSKLDGEYKFMKKVIDLYKQEKANSLVIDNGNQAPAAPQAHQPPQAPQVPQVPQVPQPPQQFGPPKPFSFPQKPPAVP